MKDILLTSSGDLAVSEQGDIGLTDSVCQAVKIRLQWFLEEWRFAPQYGVPYFELFLVKKPSIEQMRRAIRDEVMTVEEVTDVRNITIVVDAPKRTARISLDIVTDEEILREEVVIHATV